MSLIINNNNNNNCNKTSIFVSFWLKRTSTLSEPLSNKLHLKNHVNQIMFCDMEYLYTYI